MKLIAAYPLVQ